MFKDCLVKGASWGEQEASNPNIRQEFLQQVGAKPTSKDVHWPMTLSIRVRPVAQDGTVQRSSGLRQRSKAKIAERNAKKKARYQRLHGR